MVNTKKSYKERLLQMKSRKSFFSISIASCKFLLSVDSKSKQNRREVRVFNASEVHNLSKIMMTLLDYTIIGRTSSFHRGPQKLQI